MLIEELRKLVPVRIAGEIARETGTSIYLVGGAVRDSLTESFFSGDCDFTLTGEFDSIVAHFVRRVRGHAIAWDCNQTRVVYRDEAKKHITVDFALLKAPALEDDLRLRDFTVNAMALDVSRLSAAAAPEIIDPLGGQADLKEKRIRICSPRAFQDDPLRMLRAVRFARQLGFTIDSTTLASCCDYHELIERVSVERTKKELFSTLNLPAPGLSLRQLLHTGLLRKLLPETAQWLGYEQCPPHEFMLLEHCLKAVEHLDAETADAAEPVREYLDESLEQDVTRRSLLMFAGLVHDSGKPGAAKTLEGRLVFHGHDQQGARVNRLIARRLGLGRRCSRMVEQMTENHMRFLQLTLLEKPSERAKLRFLRDCGDVAVEVVLLALADMSATSSDPAYRAQLEKARRLAGGLLEKAFAPPADQDDFHLLTGRDVMQELCLQESRDVGSILKELHRAERDGRIQTREQALLWLKTCKK